MRNKYEGRLKRVAKKAFDEFNRLFPRSRSKKQIYGLQEYTDQGIYNQNDMLEHGLINTSKIAQTINLLEGNGLNQSPYQSLLKGRNHNMPIEKSMSNINEGVELSTGRQEEEEGNLL